MAGFGDLNIVTFLKSKMKWHQARQKLLSENVANADTPRYRPKDLKPMNFDAALRAANPSQSVRLERTHTDHFHGPERPNDAFRSKKGRDFEITPEGNGVVLEDQMMKVAENTFDYQMASTLYSRSLGLLRTALGRNG